MEEYPYFMQPVLQKLRETEPTGPEAERLRRILAANIGDVSALRIMLGIDPEEFASFYPDMAGPDLSTCDTIDSFLTQFGNPAAPTPQAALEIPNTSYFGEEEMAGDGDLKSAIEALRVPVKETEPQEPKEPAPTIARANELIKKHDYNGALQIIQQLSLINPQKSVYFADQIRFLKKLIVNDKGQNS